LIVRDGFKATGWSDGRISVIRTVGRAFHEQELTSKALKISLFCKLVKLPCNIDSHLSTASSHQGDIGFNQSRTHVSCSCTISKDQRQSATIPGWLELGISAVELRGPPLLKHPLPLLESSVSSVGGLERLAFPQWSLTYAPLYPHSRNMHLYLFQSQVQSKQSPSIRQVGDVPKLSNLSTGLHQPNPDVFVRDVPALLARLTAIMYRFSMGPPISAPSFVTYICTLGGGGEIFNLWNF
jgi:hypothetical protein